MASVWLSGTRRQVTEDVLIQYLEQVAESEQRTTITVARKRYDTLDDDGDDEDDDEGWA